MSYSVLPIVLLLGASAQSAPTAAEEFAKLQQQAHTASVAGDRRGRLEAVLKMRTLLNDAPDAIKAVAQAYAGLGDTSDAIASLKEYAALGQVDEGLLSGTDSKFSALHGLPEYKAILERFASNKTPVSRSETAFVLEDAGLLPEDIDYDRTSESFLITSVLERKIVRVAASGKATDFADSPNHWPMLAIKVDAARGTVWATEVAMDGFAGVPKADWGRSAVMCFDLKTGAMLRRIEGPQHTALGDMALGQQGEPLVSDGGGGGVYRVVGAELKLVDKRDFISPQTPALVPDSDRVFVADYARGIGILNWKSESVTWLNRGAGNAGKKVALYGTDGLYFDRGSVILIQNGSSPERVVRLRLDATLTRVTSEEIIERGTATLGDPTHGVVVGDSFFYIANSGWDELDEHGELKPGSKPTPARVMRFRLR
jgi:sugar lactone lactonase YvrE